MFRLSVVTFVLACLGAAWTESAVAQSREAVVWAVGDAGDGTAEALSVSQMIQADDPDAFLYLGDVYPRGTAQDFAQRYDPIFGALKPITFPTNGNNDWRARAQGYDPYWRSRTKGRRWYRFTRAGWEVIALNSLARHDKRSPQVRWLKRVLAERRGTCRLAFWHHALRSPGLIHGGARDVAPFWAALRGRARLVLNAQDHMMIRYKPIQGLIQYMSGAGGQLLYDARPDRRAAYLSDGERGALRIVLSRGRAKTQFRSPDGLVLDSANTRCKPLTRVR